MTNRRFVGFFDQNAWKGSYNPGGTPREIGQGVLVLIPKPLHYFSCNLRFFLPYFWLNQTFDTLLNTLLFDQYVVLDMPYNLFPTWGRSRRHRELVMVSSIMTKNSFFCKHIQFKSRAQKPFTIWGQNCRNRYTTSDQNGSYSYITRIREYSPPPPCCPRAISGNTRWQNGKTLLIGRRMIMPFSSNWLSSANHPLFSWLGST